MANGEVWLWLKCYHSLNNSLPVPTPVRHRLFVLLLFLGIGLGNASQAQVRYGETFFLPADGVDPTGYSLSGALTLILNGELNIPNARDILLQAADSDDPTIAPILKDIAYAYQDGYINFTYQALYALWRIGEPTRYFLNLAQNYKESWLLSKYAIEVISARPDSATFALIQPLWEESNLGWVQGAVDTYEMILWLESTYETLTPEERSWTLMNRLQTTIALPSPAGPSHEFVGVYKGDAESDLLPSVIWAHEKLPAFAAAYPHLIQQRISELTTIRTEHLDASEQAEWRARFEAYLTDMAFPNGVPPSTEH